MSSNPFDPNYVAPEPEAAPEPKGPLLTKAGAYADISNEDYHRNPDLLPQPSLSSSGVKTLLTKSPRHYWWDSVMNQNRPPEWNKDHLVVGKAIHDALLLPDRWNNGDHYHTVPDGFTAAHSIKWADYIPGYRKAVRLGKSIIKESDVARVNRMAEVVAKDDLASALLMSGTPEMTIVWQDDVTGAWCRARPDVLPDMRAIVPDVKSSIDGSPVSFEKSADKFRYLHSAAFYLDGLNAVFGEEERKFVFIVIEKDEPFTVTIYQADEGDIELARIENRRAINLFAECLNRGTSIEAWPDYGEGKVLPLTMAPWTRNRINKEVELGLLSYHN